MDCAETYPFMEMYATESKNMRESRAAFERAEGSWKCLVMHFNFVRLRQTWEVLITVPT